jgi:hypothetical protein
MQYKLLAAAVALGLGAASFNANAADDTTVVSSQNSEIAELKAQLAALQAQVAELEERTDAQSGINVQTAQAVEKLQDDGKTTAGLAKLVNDNSIGGKMYFDLTNVSQKNNGTKTANSGTGVDVKRFYLSASHKFDDNWSANLTTDFNYVSNDSETQVYVKKAYVQRKFSDALSLRLGSADLPWVPFAEDLYGYRYVENVLVDRLKFGTSADWGVHAMGGGGDVNYAISMINGAGYKNPSRSKSVDFEGRLGFSPMDGLMFAVGGYSGHLGKETQTVNALHTASRFDALAAYAKNNVRFGVEYFKADNWTTVLSPASDKADGYSVWGSLGFDNGMSLFARYDSANPSKNLDPSLDDTYYNVGLEFPAIKGVKFSAVYKHDLLKDNGLVDLKTNEFGLWSEIKF